MISASDPVRIGAIDFLNARPLVFGLDEHPSGPSVTWDIPSALARKLHAGDLDYALVPQVEAVRERDYRIVPGPCVSCRGEVESILLFGPEDWSGVRRVGTDRASRSSAELLRVLFHLRHGVVPETVEVPSDLSALDSEDVDAVLLIGDPALAHRHADHPRTDLGRAWWDAVGLPFVFAVWLGRVDAPESGRDCVRAVWGANLPLRESMARDYVQSEPGLLNVREAVRYLTRTIRYELGPEEIEALTLFARLRHEIGSDVPADWNPHFFADRHDPS